MVGRATRQDHQTSLTKSAMQPFYWLRTHACIKSEYLFFVAMFIVDVLIPYLKAFGSLYNILRTHTYCISKSWIQISLVTEII